MALSELNNKNWNNILMKINNQYKQEKPEEYKDILHKILNKLDATDDQKLKAIELLLKYY